MVKGEKDPSDIRIGQRIKLGRNTRHLTQKQLGERIGVSVQQVQKYESAVDRVSASKLRQVADALRLPVSYFLDTEVVDGMADGLDDQAREFGEALAAIPDPMLRRRLLLFTQAIRDDLVAAEERIRERIRAELQAELDKTPKA